MADLFPKDLKDLTNLNGLTPNGGEELLGRLMNNFWQERQISTDIKEFDDHYEVKADLPGIEKENIKVSYVNDTLTISATQTKTDEEKDEAGRYLRRERSSSSYQRTFTMKDIDDENIKAKFDNGVLTLDLPKASYKDAPGKNIPIE